jgi:hypothetical protein
MEYEKSTTVLERMDQAVDFSTLYNLPGWMAALIIVGFLLVLSFVLIHIVHRRFTAYVDQKTDIVSLYSSSSGVLYSVLLALMTVNAWENINTLDDAVEVEAFTLGDIYRDVDGLPEDIKITVRNGLWEYARDVHDIEWPNLGKGVVVQSARGALDTMYGAVLHFKPKDFGESNIHAEVLKGLNKVAYYHRKRMASVNEEVYPILWVVVWVGGLVNLGINALAASGHRMLDYVLQGTYALNIGLVVYLIFSLDHPFVGAVTVSPEPFKYVMGTMKHVDQHPLGGHGR